MASNTLVIDGSVLEGGGQILRNAAALSCLLGQPITVNNIRAGRSNPGLRPQHLTGLQLISDICGGTLEGGRVKSTKVTFHPRQIKTGSYVADTQTAGSICLLIQAALPCLLYANGPIDITIKGGTNADMAPQIDYLTMVFKPIAAQFGLNFDCDIRRRGYYPKGGGEVILTAQPLQQISPINLTKVGNITRIVGRAFVAGVLPIKVAAVMARVAQDLIRKSYRSIPIQIDTVKEQSAVGTGTGIIIMAETSTGMHLAGSALGKKGVPAEEVGMNAAQMLLSNLAHGGCVDEYLQDQLVILMALASGKSSVQCGPITLHTQTAIHVAQTLTKAKFTIEELGRDSNLITCEGIGLQNNNTLEREGSFAM